MNVHIAKASATTGNLLQTMIMEKLRETKVADKDCHICYGVGHQGNRPTLNANCSRHTKQEQARILQEGLGLGSIKMLAGADMARAHLRAGGAPLFARTAVHSKGRDIKVVLEPWQVEPLLASGSSFFTVHQPSVREFRTWVYRNYHLGTYEKILRRPEDCKRLGRNYDNGFDFSGIETNDVPEGIKDISRRAIAALGLDFGAVDLLETPDHRYVVLEVNSAPGVSNERRKVIVNLAHRIVRWMANDCPGRKADGRTE